MTAFILWVLLLAILLYWPVSNLIWTFSVRRKQKKLKQELGEGLTLEQGAALTELAGPPDFGASPKGPSGEQHQAPATDERPKVYRSQKSKPASSTEATNNVVKAAPKRAKPDAQPTAKPARKPRHKDKKTHDVAPQKSDSGAKTKARSGAKQNRRKERGNQAFEEVKPSRKGKARHTSKTKATNKNPAQRAKHKGGDARPFRKPSKRP